MSLKIYNTRTRQKELFKPVEPGKANIYVCGVTVYDDCHIGHGRAYVTFDVIVRYLKYLGYQVKYVRNITDIDDKIINKAQKSEEKGTLREKVLHLTEQYAKAFHDAMDQLNVENPNEQPCATEYLPQMIDLIEKLLKQKRAYQVGEDIFFDIGNWEKYGALSGRNLEDLKAGARVEVDKRKKNPLDFALWKKAKPDEPSWKSPWGDGRPGWHLECSAMSMEHLGAPFDIHGGGQDLIFPHHENELAQSEAATGKEFVRYWVHNGFVTVDKEKMSKSLGNFFLLKDVFQRFEPELVRYYFLTQHYRTPMEFSDAVLQDCKEGFKRIQSCFSLTDLYKRRKNLTDEKNIQPDKKIMESFKSAMNDDFNTPKTLAILHEIVGKINSLRESGMLGKSHLPLIKAFSDIMNLLGVKFIGSEDFVDWPHEKLSLGRLSESQLHDLLNRNNLTENEVQTLSSNREILRKEKKYTLADQIRIKIGEQGYTIEDTPEGPRPKRKD